MRSRKGTLPSQRQGPDTCKLRRRISALNNGEGETTKRTGDLILMNDVISVDKKRKGEHHHQKGEGVCCSQFAFFRSKKKRNRTLASKGDGGPEPVFDCGMVIPPDSAELTRKRMSANWSQDVPVVDVVSVALSFSVRR